MPDYRQQQIEAQKLDREGLRPSASDPWDYEAEQTHYRLELGVMLRRARDMAEPDSEQYHLIDKIYETALATVKSMDREVRRIGEMITRMTYAAPQRAAREICLDHDADEKEILRRIRKELIAERVGTARDPGPDSRVSPSENERSET